MYVFMHYGHHPPKQIRREANSGAKSAAAEPRARLCQEPKKKAGTVSRQTVDRDSLHLSDGTGWANDRLARRC
jgi:hypothetical protein